MNIETIKNKLKAKLNTKETEFLPAVLEVTETPPSPLGRLLLWSLVIVILGAVGWALFGSVDEVAVASGKIIPVGNVKTIQVEDKGTVKAIYVKDGDIIKAGQPLIDLDQTYSGADLQRLRANTATLQLEVERLEAEQAGLPFMPSMRPGLEQKDIDAQVSSYTSRVNDYRTKLAAAENSVMQTSSALEIAKISLQKYKDQYAVAQEKEIRVNKLVEENAIAYFSLMDYRSKRMDLEQSLVAQMAEISRSEAALAQSRNSLTSIMTTYQSEVATKLLDSRKQLITANEELKKAERKRNLEHIVSPIDGRVSQLSIHTVGGVVTEAQPLMTIVPEDAMLQVEAWIANKDIGFIYTGQEAEVKVETFNFQRYGTIQAKVGEISPDAVEDKEKGRVYRVVLDIDQEKVLVEDKYQSLGVGMSVTGDIKIRQKRIYEFFFDTFRKYQNEALRER